jgi:hypothetical protein
MLHNVPLLPTVPTPGIVQLSWPTALVRGSSGKFLGFAMPRLDFGKTAKLESFLQPKYARTKNLRTDLGARITVAANLAGVITAIHNKGHRIVDLKPVNLKFYRKELYVAVLDCDGFEIQVPGRAFTAPQVTPEYLAPEFQGKPVTDPERQDRFALAVIIFKLLNSGIHPYSGIAKDRNAPTDLEGKIASGLYAYSENPNSRIGPNPVSAHHCFPGEIRTLFDRAFGANFYARPTVQEWFVTLNRYALTSSGLIVQCKSRHLHFAGNPCGMCHRESILSGGPGIVLLSSPATKEHPVSTAAGTNPANASPNTSPTRPGKSRFALKWWWLVLPLIFVLAYCSKDEQKKIDQTVPTVTQKSTEALSTEITEATEDEVPRVGAKPAKYTLYESLMFGGGVIAISGFYFGYRWARKRRWWILFSIIIGAPMGAIATVIVAAVFIGLTEMLLISSDEKAAIEQYDRAKKMLSDKVLETTTDE